MSADRYEIMNAYEKIRAALELAESYMAGALREEREKYAGRESISDAGSIAADIEANKAALSALAELEKAASVVEIAARADAELRKLRLELADSNCELVSIRHQLASAEKVMPELFEFAERADAEIAELRRLLGDAREVIEDARIWLAIDPRGREQDLFVIAHLLERIDAAQGVDLCGDHHASTAATGGLSNQVRNLERNNDVARGAIDAVVQNTVGPGKTEQPIMRISDNPIDRLADVIEQHLDLIDADILDRLVAEKLQTVAELEITRGKAFAEVVESNMYWSNKGFADVPTEYSPTEAQVARLEQIGAEINALHNEDIDGDEPSQAQVERLEKLEQEMEQIEAQASRPIAAVPIGVLVTLNYAGMVDTRDVIRAEDAKALRQSRGTSAGSSSTPAANTAPAGREDLTQAGTIEIAAHRQAGLALKIR